MEAKLHTFPCGCSFPIIGERPGDTPLLDLKVRRAPLTCSAVWSMLAKGLTKGIFQLESSLGRQWTKRLLPADVEHLIALCSILRPGSLHSVLEDGVSTTEHYCRRKNGEEEVTPYHPVVDEVLKDTYGLQIYQESSLRLVKETAGFDLIESDSLRRAIGKKKADEMAKAKALYLERAKTFGVLNEKQAEYIFAQIEASQRYSFNRSHAAGYGLTTWDTAYAKAHNPPCFFAAWIKNAVEKPKPTEERSELIQEARLMAVEVVIPNFKKFERYTAVDHGIVRLGLADIKGMGESTIRKLIESVKSIGIPTENWSWGHVICRLASLVSTSTLVTLARAGAFHAFGVDRKRAAFEFEQLGELSEKEWAWVTSQRLFEDCIALFKAVGWPKKEGGGCATVNRAAKLRAKAELLGSPPFSLSDTPIYVLTQEVELFGCGVSLTRVDTCDNSDVNCSCKEFLDGASGPLILGVEIKQIRPTTTKKGKNPGAEMAWLTVGDSTAEVKDVPLFPEVWAQLSHLISPNKTVYLLAEQDKKRKGTMIVKNVWPMKALTQK